MATINTSLEQFPDKVPVGSTFHVVVEVDNMENVAPIFGGNCKPEDTQGELVDVEFNMSSPSGGTVVNEKKTVCALYGWNRPKAQVVFTVRINEKGTFTANIIADTQRDRGENNTNNLGPYSVEVTDAGDAPSPSPPPDEGPDDGGNGAAGLLNTAIENPVGAGIIFIGGTMALNTAVNSLTDIGE